MAQLVAHCGGQSRVQEGEIQRRKISPDTRVASVRSVTWQEVRPEWWKMEWLQSALSAVRWTV